MIVSLNHHQLVGLCNRDAGRFLWGGSGICLYFN